MKSTSYHQLYFKTYLWQGASFLIRFFSMFIVMPFLSKVPSMYGIYALIVSVTIFLTYADLGFLRAGQKYAAEAYAKNDRESEMRFLGFGAFILLLFISFCAIVFFFLSANPEILIKDIGSDTKLDVASNLFFILACFTPITAIQRVITMIFDVRLEGYINQRLTLISSIISIVSIYFFFRDENYEIVAYFLFLQLVNLLVLISGVLIIKKRYSYDFIRLLKYIRFDSNVYEKVKGLAYSGLYVMIVWIFFYELDQLVIGKFLGAEKVALYSVALMISTLFRSVFGILFSPFVVQANYYIGNNDEDGFKKFILQLYTLSAPLIVIPTLAFALMSKSFIISWVGPSYTESIHLAILFSLLFSMCFISYSSSTILIAKVRVKEMYFVATIQPLIFWLGIFFTYRFWGLLSFPLFKVIGTLVSEAYYFIILSKFLQINPGKLIARVLYPLILPLLFLFFSLSFFSGYFSNFQSSLNLLIVLAFMSLAIGLSFIIHYFTSFQHRIFIKEAISKISRN